MRKSGMRFISAALAACMMASVLPVSAFASGGGTDPESSISTQAAVTGTVLKDGEKINDTYIETHGNTFSISGNYKTGNASCITIDTNKDVTINIDGDVNFDNSDSDYPMVEIKNAKKVMVNVTKDMTYTCRYARFLDIGNVQELRVNSSGHTIKSSLNASNFLRLKTEFHGQANIIGGQYEWKECPFVMSGSGTCTFDDVSVTSNSINISQLSGNVYINGGTYKNITKDRQNVSSTVRCSGSNAKMEINGATLSSADGLANVRAIEVGNNASVVVNGGKITGYYALYVGENGNLEINKGTDGSSPEIDGSFCAVWFCKGADVKLNSGTYTTLSGSQEATIRADYPAGKIYLGNITVSRSGARGGKVLNISNSQEAIIDGTTIKNGTEGIIYASGNIILKQADFENNNEDIAIYENNLLNVKDTFTGTAKVSVYSQYGSGYFDDAEGRQITVATNGIDYQKKLNLVSHDSRYIVSYKKNEDGSEYRYLTRGYNVKTVDSVATVKDDDVLKTLDKSDRIEKNTQVTVTPAEKPGFRFTGWKVEGLELKEEDKDKVPLTFTMPGNNVTITANYDVTEPDPTPDRPAVNTKHLVTVVNGTAMAEDSTAAAASVEAKKGTNVVVTPAEKPGSRFTGWTVKVDGTEVSDLLTFPDKIGDTEETDYTKAQFKMPDADVTIEANYDVPEPVPSDPVNTDDGSADGGAGAVVAGVLIGGATYLVGTDIWLRNIYGFIPTNRMELAKALWSKADCPAPGSTELYADIEQNDADAQAAARWCVEQGLLKDYTRTNDDGTETVSFKPGRYVARPYALTRWYKLEKLLSEQQAAQAETPAEAPAQTSET